ncbi:CDGSH iron-sulfur domain-containing protein [Thauera sinica]|uniref:CDGSH iron-sulfur domain-containing protein n=1 Tax=Thauera sinica TaxID=2665146 RepID=A0ABW1ARE1_9RHOO|nr:CDGSH iron-sulfur domain-containing protein [Thauera sp. K11]ATE59730.1 glutamate synthase [Thauera sp. K11]
MSGIGPHVARRGPYVVEAEAGKQYFWCACGRSRNQPFCDGSHEGSGFGPVEFTPETDGTVFLCGCKHTAGVPYCDGSHKKL